MTACISRSGYKQRDSRKIQSVLKFWLIVLRPVRRSVMQKFQDATLYERDSSPIKCILVELDIIGSNMKRTKRSVNRAERVAD